MPNPHHTSWIKQEAKRLGFDYCGISKAGFLEEEAPRLEKWLKANMHGRMDYMANHFDKRLDPTKLVDGARSVISLLINYYPEQQQNPDAPRISRYAYGAVDYHRVIKDKLFMLVESIREHIGEVNGRVFVDSAPVMDKAWAAKSGLGWIGKNANLIRKGEGSYFFIAELICDLELEEDRPVTDHCGSCTRCMDACPTGAIAAPYVVDGSRCISYFTIELKDEIPTSMKGQFNDWVFGCDVCQEVCPWNRFAESTTDASFRPPEGMLDWDREAWTEITEDVFKKVFGKSALQRPGFEGFKRNLKFVWV
ncbi:MAG: tRNA epoxyqueuosine(34) reductase QueG [Flavobacteriales bacterium]|nr:tRNA epoxyqueuosine(34) reductase QueG [Flavobacteriales bacterium]